MKWARIKWQLGGQTGPVVWLDSCNWVGVFNLYADELHLSLRNVHSLCVETADKLHLVFGELFWCAVFGSIGRTRCDAGRD